jgi:hypothetical protein
MDGTPTHYRAMARHSVDTAERVTDPFLKSEYLKIARAYESLANDAERRCGTAQAWGGK